jgi:hypothetical protein
MMHGYLEGTGRPQLWLRPRELFPVLLSRLADHELSEIGRYAVPIEPDSTRELRRSMNPEPLLLPKLYLAGEALLGRSSRLYDHDKSSFRYPLLLSATRGSSRMRYLVSVHDFHGSVEVSFHRVREREQVDSIRSYQPPIDHELSRRDLNCLSDCIVGFLCGKAEAAMASAPCFHRSIGSVMMAYGMRRGDLFERRFESIEELEGFLREVRDESVDAERASDLAYVTALLDSIDGFDATR